MGPIKISGSEGQFSAHAPLATYESPVWPSVGRGAKLSRLTENGIVTTLIDEKMTRSILLIAPMPPSQTTPRANCRPNSQS